MPPAAGGLTDPRTSQPLGEAPQAGGVTPQAVSPQAVTPQAIAAPLGAAPQAAESDAVAPSAPGIGEATGTAATASTAGDGTAASNEAAAVRNWLTVERIESRKSQWLESKDLPEAVRVEITDLCARAIERLNEALQTEQKIAALKSESAAVVQETQRLQALLAQPENGTALPDGVRGWSGDQIRLAHQTAENALEDSRKRLTALQGQIEWRTRRARELPELITQAQAKLDEITQQLNLPAVPGEPLELAAARRLRLEAGRLFRTRDLESLQQETRTFSDAARVMVLRRDAADREVRSMQRQVTGMAAVLSDWEKREADQQALAALRAAANAHPAVREAAQVNTVLAEANASLVASMESARTDLAKVEKSREELRAQYSDTRRRAEEAKFSQAIGMMLRSQQSELPDVERYRVRAAKRSQEQADLNLKLLEWENERRKIESLEEVVEKHLQKVSEQLGLIEQVDVRSELNQVFQRRLALYAELSANGREQLGRLAALQTAEEGLATVVNQQAAFISQNILWVRSTAPLTPSLISPTLTGFTDLVKSKSWLRVVEDLKGDWRTSPLYGLLILPPCWLLIIRRRLMASLAATAQAAQRSSATGMAPTFQALGITLLLAVPIPALVALFGWRLLEDAVVGDFSYALGKAMSLSAAALAGLRFVSITCHPNGLGENHFGWESDVTAALRRATSMARMVCVPASFLCLFTAFTGDELLISTVGRIALIVDSMALAVIAMELFRPSGPLARMITASNEATWFRLTYYLWSGVLVAAPLVLTFVSAIGFHYTATRLSTRMAATWGVIALVIGLRAVAMRWVLVVYRRLALRRGREKRAALQLARSTGNDEGGPDSTPPPDTSMELKLSDVNAQSQRLIRIAVTVLGGLLLMFIWQDVLPALGYFNRFEFWNNSVLPPNEQGELQRVTLVDLFLGGIWIGLTVIACRNLPGLLDLSIFQRLPLDAGARYAASALTQYVLVVIGAAISFGQIGVGWHSVQWLVAAMTVGLGFGLQEIFANFVSGIILLFERPIRVGDTVTVGTVSGTVTRIRIRATTVLDWDNKELIVPNRNFVTGNLVNWTLSSPNLRVVIQVGIAYGSDTRLAVRLLQEVAAANPLTLTDPAPVVVFSQFGASSLDFELRAFTGMSNLRVLRHELHLAIDDAFREHGIEIAFPQQDLHVRSFPAPLLEAGLGAAPRDRSAAATDLVDSPAKQPAQAARKHVA